MARQMKDSGIEWIGEIPEAWETSRVGLHYSINLGKMLCPNQVSENYTLEPYFCAADVHFDGVSTEGLKQMWFSADEKEAYIVHNGDLLVVEGGAGAGGCAIARNMPRATYIQNSIMIVRKKNGDNRFLRYLIEMLVKRGYIDIVCNKATIPHFTKDKLANVPLPILSDNEMSSIADFLDRKCAEIDAVIERTKATIEEYKKLKQAVITEAVTKGVRGPRPMKDSGIEWIGEIPEEWSQNSIKNVAETCSGGTPTSNDESMYDGDINWVCSYDLHEKPIIESGRKITEIGAASIAGKLQSRGSVLIAMYGGAGTIGNSGILECEARTNQAICSIKFNNAYVLDYYGFYYIMAIRKYWMMYAVGTRKDPNISQDIVKRMRCIIPPIVEQQEIISYLDEKCAALDTLIAKKTALLTELETYKKSLIYEYVTGKKEVM